MSYYDEEFYEEPSEFEQQIDEFKTSIVNSIKEGFKTEMEQLRKENAELQVVKKDMEKIRNDFRRKEIQFESDRKDMEQAVRRERLSVLMKNFEVLMFRADYKNIMPPKCDNCNENRRIPFITPLGRQSEEDCNCKFTTKTYFPAEYIASSFRIGDNNEMLMWYKMNPERDYDHASWDSGALGKTIWKEGMEYEENHYRTYFKTQADCQKFCDWLTEKRMDKREIGYL